MSWQDTLPPPQLRTHMITFAVQQARMPDLVWFIQNDPSIRAYWNYVPLVYCVKTYATASELARRLQPFFPFGGYMVAEVDPKKMDGLLPQAAWDWFNAPVQPRTLGGLASFGQLAGPQKPNAPRKGVLGALDDILGKPK